VAKGAKDKVVEFGMVQLRGARCRCGHEWLPRVRDASGAVERPSVCPKCKSPRWDRPKREPSD
jgi:predicted Zn-ribbon and HTH transcriptional regulator